MREGHCALHRESDRLSAPLRNVTAVTLAGMPYLAAKTALQPGESFDFSFLRHMTILLTFGISPAHSRNTSGVQAARCSAVAFEARSSEPDAKAGAVALKERATS